MNAYVDPGQYNGGDTDGSIATAQPIDPYANSFIGNDSRTAVLGQITGSPLTFGDALVVEDQFGETGVGDVLVVDQKTGNVLDTFTSPDFSDLVLFDIALAPDNTFYVLGDLNLYTGVIVHMNLGGQTLGEFTMPVTDNPGFESPEGFGLDPTDGSFWVPLTNSATVVHVSSSGTLLGSYAVAADPDDAAVGPDGNIYVSQVLSGYIGVLNPTTGSYSQFTSSPFPLNLTWSAAGDLWVGDLDEGVEEFNNAGTLINLYGFFYTSAGEPGPAGNVWDANFGFDTLYQYAPDGTELTSTFFNAYQPGLAVLGDVPGELPLPPPTEPVYSFELSGGESASIALQGLNDTNVAFTLYDDNGDVLAYSSPGATNYTAGLNNFVSPDDETYYVQVTGDPMATFNLVVTRGADFNTQPNNQYPNAQDITATELSGSNKLGGVLGYLQNTNGTIGTDFYSVNANAGDNLHFATTTPSGGPGEFVNNFYPELLLYDPNGNLVAIAAGNASDGRNSVIDFTVPDGDAGTWTMEVAPSPNTPTPTYGEYGLLATGATGALSPFVVTGTTPAAGALVQPPTDIIVTFNDPVYGLSLTPGELEVNGVAATAVTLVNANTVDWTVPSSAYATGVDLPNIVTIGADASGNQVTDVSGQTLTPFSYTFFTTNVPPEIISSSIDGSVFSPAPADVTEVVTFNQPMNTSFTTSSSFSLLGNYRNVTYAAASFSWDPTGTILTINFDDLPNDTYSLTLFAGGFESIVGIPLASNYVANFAVALGTSAFTTPFTPVNPLGDLIYTSTDDPVLVTPTDIDYLTVSLNAGETLTLIGAPTTSDLQLAITLLDPSNNVVATGSAPGQGSNAVIETAPITTTGTYTIAISDLNGNIGLYSVQATLNSFVKTATSNDTIATAQDLTGSSYGLGTGGADRLAALGTLVGGPSFGDALVVEQNDVILINQSSGHIVQTFTSPDFSDLTLFDVALAPDNTFYVLGDVNAFTGVIVHMDLLGNTLGSFTLPVSDPGTYYSPEGFGLDPTDGSFWVPLINSASLLHVDSSGNVLSVNSVPASPTDAAVGPDGKIYLSHFMPPEISVFDPTTGTDSFFASTPNPTFLTWSAAGDLWVGDFNNGAEEFDSSGNLIQTIADPGAVAAEPALSGNVWDTNLTTALVNQFTAAGSLLTSTSFSPFLPGLAVLGDVPNEAPLPFADNQDFYSFDLSAGQTATAAVESLNGLAAQISIVDGNGNVLATGVSGATNVSQAIENFVAPSTGTYYIEITGDQGLQYSVVVTRGADFTLQDHNSYTTAQNIAGTGGVLGYLAPPSAPLYTLDDNFADQLPIWQTDPTTGAYIGTPIYTPSGASAGAGPYGLNLAYDGTNLYFNAGEFDGNNTIYELNATTGAVINTIQPASSVAATDGNRLVQRPPVGKQRIQQ